MTLHPPVQEPRQFFWYPERVAIRYFPYDTPRIRIENTSGEVEVELEPVVLGYQQSITTLEKQDFISLTRAVASAIERVKAGINAQLLDGDLVADVIESDLSVFVAARVKAWPAYPGVTSPLPEDPA